uniref:Uncharacterized protein n=1 Tax=Kalanchoe fedtschenkoi TaxID=63787 RepID=A0A7N0TZS6_KALFE
MDVKMMMEVDERMMEQMVNLKSDIITKACSTAMKAHTAGSSKPYLVAKGEKSAPVIISFPAAWRVADWYATSARGPFAETQINKELFPSMKSVGLDESAKVNEAFLTRFEALLKNSELKKEVEKAGSKWKQVVFTGHSSGAAVAVLATLWLLEKRLKSDVRDPKPLPICLTFGAPLVGDKIFHHALERQKWSSCFINFVAKRDIVPRILLAPLSSIEQQFQDYLDYLNPCVAVRGSDAFENIYLEFYKTVMIIASSTVSHAASKLMGCTNMLLEALTSFEVLSPYRPFGTYVFFTGKEATSVLRNPDAVLQLMFYTCQVAAECEEAEILRSLHDHVAYENELARSLSQNIIDLDGLEELPLSSVGASESRVQIISQALDDLGVSRRGRLCLRAAGEVKRQKRRNEESINKKKSPIIACLKELEEYKARCELDSVCYYDSFKRSLKETDFKANVRRLELAGMWDEIIDLLKNYELPDDFEGKSEWIDLGTRFRRVMEPLDIANYYRHDKNGDTGPYLKKGRPKRYRFTQRWLEHTNKGIPSSESCFWAEVEELRSKGGTQADILRLETDIDKWTGDGVLGKDVFFKNSTFLEWWSTLDARHKATSTIAKHIPLPTPMVQ